MKVFLFRLGKNEFGASRIALFIVLFLIHLLSLGCSKVASRESWNEKWGPMIPHSTFPGDCSICHIAKSWSVIREDFEFDHQKETGYALEGAHEQAACVRCHNDRGPVQHFAERGCAGCHEDRHMGRLGSDCESCHVEDHWEANGVAQQHFATSFPLLGAHASAPCESCHLRSSIGDFESAPLDCHLCHQEELSLAQPNHVVNGWVRDCGECHSPLSWNAPDFTHLFFPLEGGHSGLDCGQCHVGGRVNGTPNDCYSCHSNDYINAPNHVAGSFTTDCEDCHNINAWR